MNRKSKCKNWNNLNYPKLYRWKLYIARRKRKICMCVKEETQNANVGKRE